MIDAYASATVKQNFIVYLSLPLSVEEKTQTVYSSCSLPCPLCAQHDIRLRDREDERASSDLDVNDRTSLKAAVDAVTVRSAGDGMGDWKSWEHSLAECTSITDRHRVSLCGCTRLLVEDDSEPVYWRTSLQTVIIYLYERCDYFFFLSALFDVSCLGWVHSSGTYAAAGSGSRYHVLSFPTHLSISSTNPSQSIEIASDDKNLTAVSSCLLGACSWQERFWWINSRDFVALVTCRSWIELLL